MSKRLLTDEQLEYLKENYKGRTTQELVDLMNKQFGTNFTVKQLQTFKKHNGFTSGVDTRFKKGELGSYNEARLRDIGDSFVSRKDGYHYIKVGKNKWVKKQRYLYEQAHGVKLPTRMRVIFLDGDKNNFDIDNLKAVDSRTILMAKNKNLFTSDKETTETGLLVSELILKTFDKKKCLKKM